MFLFLNLWRRLRPQESCASCVLAALAQARHCSCLSSNQSVVLCFFFKLRAAAIGAVLGHSHPARESHGATGSHRDRDRNGANVRYISRVLYPEQISVGVPGPIRPRPRGWELESQIRRHPGARAVLVARCGVATSRVTNLINAVMIRGRELELEHPKNLENDGDKPAASDKTSSYECLFTGKSEFNLEFEFYPLCAGPRENCPS